jgi:uncharacterized damage-inducible protein DinB
MHEKTTAIRFRVFLNWSSELKEKRSSPPMQQEPWLRGTLVDVPAVARGILHALELANEDIEKWCGVLTEEELNARPGNVAPVAFHLRHIARSLDRLLTYAEGGELSEGQRGKLKTEIDEGGTAENIFAELKQALELSAKRVRLLATLDLEQPRFVGHKRLQTTLGGLLVHIADHTQRHVGQAITTAKMVKSRCG